MVQDGPKKRPKLEPDPDSSKIVRRIFDMSEAGKSTLDIARILNDGGITSLRGNPWGKTTVHKVLINETYTGTLVWGVNAKDGADPVRVDDAFPAIVPKAQFTRVAKLMRSRGPKVVNPRRVADPATPRGSTLDHSRIWSSKRFAPTYSPRETSETW